MNYKPYVEKFKISYESIMEVLSTLAQALSGLMPAFFASNFLMEISGLKASMSDFWAIVISGGFAVVLEVLGFAILRKATAVFLSKFNGLIPSWLPIACGVVYVANMMLLTTLHGLLPKSLHPISIGLLCLMPVVGYISNGIQKAEDEAKRALAQEQAEQAERDAIEKEQARIEADAERSRLQKIEDEERAARLAADAKRLEMELEIAKMKAEAEANAKMERAKARSMKRSTGTDSTEERGNGTKNGTNNGTESDKPKAVFDHIKDKGFTSTDAISNDTGIPKTTVHRILSKLAKEKKIYKIETGEKPTYELNGWH